MSASVEYLGKIGFRKGMAMHGFLVNTQMRLQEIRNKKVVLLGMGENSIYAEMLLREKKIPIFAYADNSTKLQGRILHGKKICSPYEFVGKEEYYIIISVNQNIATARLQCMVYGVQNYSIFVNHPFHDFCDEDQVIHNVLMEAINTLCFEGEELEYAIPYIANTAVAKEELGKLNFCMYSTLWSHWAYIWAKNCIEEKNCKEIFEIGPGYGLMSLLFLKMYSDIHIDWLIFGERGEILEESNSKFDEGLKKVKELYRDRVCDIYGMVERDVLSNKKYNLIIITEVLEHWALNPVKTLKKIVDKLYDNGKIVLTTPNWGHLPIYRNWRELPDSEDITKKRYYELLQCGHVYQYDKEELITIFSESGLRVEKYELSDYNNHNFLLEKL